MIPASLQPLACPVCRTVWPAAAISTGQYVTCAGCGSASRVEAWPALYRAEENGAPAQANLTGEAACFHHPGKMAVSVCEQCGRFLCGLCDINLHGHHRCASCIQQERASTSPQRSSRFEARRIMYDSLAVSLAFLPLLIFFLWFLSIFCAPAALYVVVRYWRSPLSILPRTRVRFVIAFIGAAAQVVGWITLAVIGIRGLIFSGGPS